MHTAFVRGVIRRSTSSGSRLGTSRETISANTGVAPQYSAAAAVAANVNEGTITSSPGPTPAARYARCRAAVQLDTAIAWRAPRCAAKASSNSAVRGPSVSQPERSVAATASRSCGCSCRSNSGSSGKVSAAAVLAGASMCGRRSGNVPVAAVERIAERFGVERGQDLGDAVGYGHERLEAQLFADPVEAHLVVARVLVAVHVGDAAAIGLLAELLDQVELAVVLARAPGIEDAPGDLLLRRLEHLTHRAAGVAHVDVGAPELLAEDLELAVGPEFAAELVDSQIEAHAPPDAVDRREPQAGRRQAVGGAEDQLLHSDLLLGIQRDRAQLAVLGDRHRRVRHAPVVRAGGGEHQPLDASLARVGHERLGGLHVNFVRQLGIASACGIADDG